MNDNSHSQHCAVEKLEVEDEEDRQIRIQSFLEKLNSTGNRKPPVSAAYDFSDRMTHSVTPPTELLSRVQAFLPQMEASNTILAQRVQADPKSVDIENVEDGMGQYIEMNLGLGIFEDRARSKAQEHQDTEMSNSSSDTSESSGMGDDDSDCDTDSSSEIITCFAPSRPIRPLPRRVGSKVTRPQIVVLGEEAMNP